MGFFDKLFGGNKEAAKPAKPADITVAYEAGKVYAPVAGTTIQLADAADPVFASGAMGQGIAIKPSNEVVYAPVSGEVTATTGTLHALGFMGDDGTEVLIHVGIDTVEMKGKGFQGFVEKGQKVAAGQALMTFSKDEIAAAGKDDTVFVIITNTDDFASVTPTTEASVEAGAAVITCTK